MNIIRSFCVRLRRSPISRLASFALVVLVMLAWTVPAFCDPIHDAAKQGDLEKVQALLKESPDLVSSKDNNGATPLLWAADNGHTDVVELLLANKADVNAKTDNGSTPLHDAASKGHRDVVELLLANKADVNAKAANRATPLHMAALKGQKDVAELLRLHGDHE